MSAGDIRGGEDEDEDEELDDDDDNDDDEDDEYESEKEVGAEECVDEAGSGENEADEADEAAVTSPSLSSMMSSATCNSKMSVSRSDINAPRLRASPTVWADL